MRLVLGRILATLVVLAGAGYLLQVDDGTVAGTVFPQPVQLPPSVRYFQPDNGRDFYTSRRAVIRFGRSTLELPILMYHYIRTPPSKRTDLLGYNLSVAPNVFNAQMDWLAAHGYHTVTFNDVRLYWEHVTPLPPKPVILTFDDGYADLYTTAFPILVAHNFTAVAYIVSGFVGFKGYVTSDQILQMDHYGLEIGAHTVNHADLARSSQPWLTYQVVASKRWLESLVGHPVIDMAYPSGKFNQQVILAVERAGYYSAVTTEFSLLHTEANRYVWARVRVSGGEPMSMFISNLGASMPTVILARMTSGADRLSLLLQS